MKKRSYQRQQKICIQEGECNIYTFDKNYFDEIDTIDKAYQLGFIWCDGYVSYRNRNGAESYDFKLSLSNEDIVHLKLFKFYLKSNHIIREYDIKGGFETSNKEARLLICNKYFGKALYEKYGLVPNRHIVNDLIDKIPYKFRYHFIRGILDADGCIVKRDIEYKKTNASEYSINFSTYEELLIYINNVFLQDGLTNTKYKIAIRHEGEDGYCRMLRITGNHIVSNILTQIYSSSENLRLERKYSRYIDLLQYIQGKGDM